MSTKSTILNHCRGGHRDADGEITIHVYKDMHEPSGTVNVELGAVNRNVSYTFMVTELVGMQLAQLLKKGLEKS